VCAVAAASPRRVKQQLSPLPFDIEASVLMGGVQTIIVASCTQVDLLGVTLNEKGLQIQNQVAAWRRK